MWSTYLESAAHPAEATRPTSGCRGRCDTRGQLAVTAPVCWKLVIGHRVTCWNVPDVPACAVSRSGRQSAGGRLDVAVWFGDWRLDDAGDSVGLVRRVVCASPQYLKKHGEPREPAELARHTIVAASPVSPSNDWRFGVGKQSVITKVRPRLSVTSNDAAIHAALQGFAITRLMSYQIASQLAAGGLKRGSRLTPRPCDRPQHSVSRRRRSADASTAGGSAASKAALMMLHGAFDIEDRTSMIRLRSHAAGPAASSHGCHAQLRLLFGQVLVR